MYNSYTTHSRKLDPVYEDLDPQLEEKIAYVAEEPVKEEEGEGGYEAYSLQYSLTVALQWWAFIDYKFCTS